MAARRGWIHSMWRRTMDINLSGIDYKDVALTRDVYGDGSLAVLLEEPSGEHIACVSAWLPVPPADGCIWVKNYSENAGVLEQCVEAGVLEVTGRTCRSGFATLPEARVLV